MFEFEIAYISKIFDLLLHFLIFTLVRKASVFAFHFNVRNVLLLHESRAFGRMGLGAVMVLISAYFTRGHARGSYSTLKN